MDKRLTLLEIEQQRTGGRMRQDLDCSLRDAGTFGVMVGCGETYLPAFALALGLGETAAGLVASVPLLAGGLIQLVSPLGIGLIGSQRRWVVLGATIQACSFIPLVAAALYGVLSLPLLLLIASVYWGGGLATGPAWNSWMERLVPRQIRANYFSFRTKIQQITTFASLLLSGFLLQYASNHDAAMIGFAGVFAAALLFRLISVGYLVHHSDGTVKPQLPPATRPAANNQTRSGIWLLVYLVLMQAFVQVSGPYFAPYMLKQLSFSYQQYVVLLSIAFVAKVLALSFCNRIANRYGALRLFWIGGIGLIPLSAMWLVSTQYAWLCLAQVFSGTAWAAYELGFFLMFFETLPATKRTKLLTYYNLANAAAIFAGASLGAYLLHRYGCQPSTYQLLFALSSTGRLACLALLLGVGSPVVIFRSLQFRVLGIRPSAGTVDSPLLPTLESPAR